MLTPSPTRARGALGAAALPALGVADGGNHGGGLQFGFGFFFLRDAVVQQGRAGAHLGDAVLDADGAQRQAGVHVAVETDHADRTAIPGARALLVVLDEAHRPEFWRARDCHGPGVAQEAVEGVHAFAQPALDMVDRVDEARIHLDLAPADDLHRAGLADAALVVAVDVRAHGELGLVLLGVQQLQDLLAVGDGVLAALDRARDRAGLDAPAVDPHEHFRRGADQDIRCRRD